MTADARTEVPPSPVELKGPRARGALTDAAIWLGVAAGLFLAWKLATALLLLLLGLIFAAGLHGGAQLLGRVVPLGRGVRLAIVVVLLVAIVAGFTYFTGSQLIAQAGQFQATLTAQGERLSTLARDYGIGGSGADPLAAIKSQAGGLVGRLTSVVGGIAGALGGLVLVVTFGIFVAADPRLYKRGVEWLTPQARRAGAAAKLAAMAAMLRRWVGGRLVLMLIDGVLVFAGLTLVGAPLPLLLAIVAGVFAFVPNVGAIIAGALIVAVGFSAGASVGVGAVAVYIVVQLAEGFINPVIEQKAVDVAPAAVLAAQLVFGTLFGILGVLLADPVVALIKVALTDDDAAAA